jgi:F0F1-type ATP synthase assembly protein I
MAEQPQPPEPPERSHGGSNPKPQSAAELTSWHRLAGVGIEFIVAFGVFGWLGWWLDKKYNTGPWLLIAGCGIGFASGLYSLIKAAKKMM